MHFTPPPLINKGPDKDLDLSKLNPNSPKVQKYTRKHQLQEKEAAQKMTQKIAEEKYKKRTDFLL